MAVAQIVALVSQHFDALLSLISDDRTHLYQIAHFFLKAAKVTPMTESADNSS